MNRHKLLKRLTDGALKNVGFSDAVNLVAGFGFRESRTKGSHHVFSRPGIAEIINLQEDQGQAKPYQLRQFLNLVEKYNLKLEGD